jgi:hypothetical protein
VIRSPSGPGSSGIDQRTGWVTENAKVPPGRRTRATSSTITWASATNCSAPNDENTMSNTSSANGIVVAVAQMDATGTPVASSIRRECCSWRSERSRP